MIATWWRRWRWRRSWTFDHAVEEERHQLVVAHGEDALTEARRRLASSPTPASAGDGCSKRS